MNIYVAGAEAYSTSMFAFVNLKTFIQRRGAESATVDVGQYDFYGPAAHSLVIYATTVFAKTGMNIIKIYYMAI